jgi:hypothetical protein
MPGSGFADISRSPTHVRFLRTMRKFSQRNVGMRRVETGALTSSAMYGSNWRFGTKGGPICSNRQIAQCFGDGCVSLMNSRWKSLQSCIPANSGNSYDISRGFCIR